MIYSKERRLEVLRACDAGQGTREVALHFNVSESWVRRVKQEYREQGKIAPRTTRNRVPKWRAIEDDIRRAVEATPDLTLAELKEELGTDLSLPTLCRALQQMHLTLKKKS